MCLAKTKQQTKTKEISTVFEVDLVIDGRVQELRCIRDTVKRTLVCRLVHYQ